MTTLVLGPARSGKSARAEALAAESGRPVTYVATAVLDPDDAEMRARVARHRAARPAAWDVVETGAPGGPALVDVLRDAPPHAMLLVDALGGWLTAELLPLADRCDREPARVAAELDARAERLTAALVAARCDVVIVAEETGWGVVPAAPLGRVFRDVLGRAARRIAARADRVELVVAGYALDLRALGTPITRNG